MGEGNPGEAMARVDELSSVVAGQGMPSNALFELVPGEYVVLCFMPDYETGQPHVMLGMVDTFTVPGERHGRRRGRSSLPNREQDHQRDDRGRDGLRR